eukprot:gene24675-biopygen2173
MRSIKKGRISHTGTVVDGWMHGWHTYVLIHPHTDGRHTTGTFCFKGFSPRKPFEAKCFGWAFPGSNPCVTTSLATSFLSVPENRSSFSAAPRAPIELRVEVIVSNTVIGAQESWAPLQRNFPFPPLFLAEQEHQRKKEIPSEEWKPYRRAKYFEDVLRWWYFLAREVEAEGSDGGGSGLGEDDEGNSHVVIAIHVGCKA